MRVLSLIVLKLLNYADSKTEFLDVEMSYMSFSRLKWMILALDFLCGQQFNDAQ